MMLFQEEDQQMETKGRRSSRAGEPTMAEPTMAEPTMAEPTMAEPTMAEPVEQPTPVDTSELPPEMTAAGASPLADTTAPAALDQTAADEPGVVQVPPPILAAAPRLAAPLHQAADFGGEAMA